MPEMTVKTMFGIGQRVRCEKIRRSGVIEQVTANLEWWAGGHRVSVRYMVQPLEKRTPPFVAYEKDLEEVRITSTRQRTHGS